jgi:hypothetical protein
LSEDSDSQKELGFVPATKESQLRRHKEDNEGIPLLVLLGTSNSRRGSVAGDDNVVHKKIRDPKFTAVSNSPSSLGRCKRFEGCTYRAKSFVFMDFQLQSS